MTLERLRAGKVQKSLNGTRQDFPRQKHDGRSSFFLFLTLSDKKKKHIKRQAKGEF